MSQSNPAVLRSFVIAVVTAVVAVMTLSAEVPFSRKDADSLVRKIIVINLNSMQSGSAAARLTPITEGEVNGYLAIHAKNQIPVGVIDPYITIIGDGRLSGKAVVDLDAVRKKSSGGWLDPMAYLTGRLPVVATGVLRAVDGTGRFTLESATVSGVTVPKSVLQQILSYYSRTPEEPNGINLDDPFELPAKIREIRIGKGEAVVVQ